MRAHQQTPDLDIADRVIARCLACVTQAVKALDNARRGMESATKQAAELEGRRSQVGWGASL